MATYIVDLNQLGKDFLSEVNSFCHAVGQPGHEADVFKECFSQMLRCFTYDSQEFTANTFMLPQWVSICFTEIKDHRSEPMQRFANACRTTAIQLYALVVLNHKYELPTVSTLYLMESVSVYTLVFSMHSDAGYL